MLHCRDGIRQVMTSAWFPPDITLCIQAKEFNLCFIRPENLISHSLRVFQVHFGKLQAGCHVPFTEEWLPSGPSTIQAWLVECCRNGCPSWRLSSVHRAMLELCQSDHRVLCGQLEEESLWLCAVTFLASFGLLIITLFLPIIYTFCIVNSIAYLLYSNAHSYWSLVFIFHFLAVCRVL